MGSIVGGQGGIKQFRSRGSVVGITTSWISFMQGHAAVLRLFGGLPNGKELLQEGVQCCQRHCMGSGETLLLETRWCC
jgi:hypothetical protein